MTALPSDEYLARFAAVLFDLDGTLIDSMPLHYAAYREVFARRGWTLEQDAFMTLVGAPARVAISKFLEAVGCEDRSDALTADIHSEKKAVFLSIIERRRPMLLPAAQLLDRMTRDQPCGLVTSGNRNGVEALLAATGWSQRFDVVITGDEVSEGKPDPQPFLLAAQHLRCGPKDCLVFEDTSDGCEAAKRAGMTVIDVSSIRVVA